MKCASLQFKLGDDEFGIGVFAQLEAQLPTEMKHSDIFTKDVGVNPTDSLGARRNQELAEQLASKTGVLKLVSHNDSELSISLPFPYESCYADDFFGT